jgi:hypothetical protein
MIADEIGDDLADSYRTCMYRFVQEALNNCARHAQATEARVVVRQDADGLCVSVQDDGIGFDPRKEKGMGLLGNGRARSNVWAVCSALNRNRGKVRWYRSGFWRQARCAQIGSSTGGRMIRVILADDHSVMRRGLRLILEQQENFRGDRGGR